MKRGRLTEFQRKIRYTRPFGDGALPDYNFPKIKFCARGHAIVGDNIRFTVRAVRCRTCAREYEEKTGRSGSLSEGTIRKVLDALHAGRTWSSLAGHHGGAYTPGIRVANIVRLKIFCDNNPKIGGLIRRLAEKNRIAVKSAPRGAIVVAPAVIRASGDIMDEIAAAVPRHLPRDLRDDVVQNIWLAVTEGGLKRSEIALRTRAFVRAEYRNNHNAWGPRSLDVPLWIDGEPQTTTGVLIQARALTAYAEAEIEVGHYRGRAGQLVGLALAQSLTRLSA